MFKVGERIIGIVDTKSRNFKGQKFIVTESDLSNFDPVIKIEPIDKEYYVDELWMSEFFIDATLFEIDKQYYREQRLEKLLN